MRIFCVLFGFIVLSTSTPSPESFFISEWAVQVNGDYQVAHKIAKKYGLRAVGKIFPDTYHFKKIGRVRRSSYPSTDVKRRLRGEHAVGIIHQVLWKRVYYRAQTLNDRFWNDMWYMRYASPSMKITRAWDLGYDGNGIVIGIIDDGVEVTHPDLRDNIKSEYSKDYFDGDNDPSPSSSAIGHGTKCAGVVSAIANNTICTVGVAFKAKLAGIRSSNGMTTSAIQGKSLNHEMQRIQIYSNSYGGRDGSGFSGPDPLVAQAIHYGIYHGRGGNGSIFVWAAGNGGIDDNCNADGFANSIYTISISSMKSDGYAASFSESCAAVLAVTYGESTTSTDIVTTKIRGQCDKSFSGTSASAPMAAGIIALALQARNDLTWRDVQHLIVNTANMNGLIERYPLTNAAGKKISNIFGFGLMDAEAMVLEAPRMKLVPSHRNCSTPIKNVLNGQIAGSVRESTSLMQTMGCKNTISEVNFLEHVQAKITFTATQRGNVELFLTSPKGTTSTLLSRRPADKRFNGRLTWEFMSIHFWGEDGKGTWTLKMNIQDSSTTGSLIDWRLTMHGTKYDPKLGKDAEPDPVTDPPPQTTDSNIQSTSQHNPSTTDHSVSIALEIGIGIGIFVCIVIVIVCECRFECIQNKLKEIKSRKESNNNENRHSEKTQGTENTSSASDDKDQDKHSDGTLNNVVLPHPSS